MAKRTAPCTWETEAGLPAGWSMVAELVLTYEIDPSEPMSQDSPGYQARAELDEARVVLVTLFDSDGKQVSGEAVGIDKDAVRELFYVHINRDRLSDWFLAHADECEQIAREAAESAREDAWREQCMHWHNQRHEARVAAGRKGWLQ